MSTLHEIRCNANLTKWFKSQIPILNNSTKMINKINDKNAWIAYHTPMINQLFNKLIDMCLKKNIIIYDDEKSFDSFCDMLYYNSSKQKNTSLDMYGYEDDISNLTELDFTT